MAPTAHLLTAGLEFFQSTGPDSERAPRGTARQQAVGAASPYTMRHVACCMGDSALCWLQQYMHTRRPDALTRAQAS